MRCDTTLNSPSEWYLRPRDEFSKGEFEGISISLIDGKQNEDTFKEIFDLVHRAQDRSIYALGALDAGAWLLDQPAGLYSARDWLAGR